MAINYALPGIFSVTYEDVLNAGFSELEVARLWKQGMNYDMMLDLKDAEESGDALNEVLAKEFSYS